MTPNEQALANQIELAEKFVLPDGSYPLRKPTDMAKIRKRALSKLTIQEINALGLHTKDSLYNDGRGVLAEAIRDKGWQYSIAWKDQGDFAQVFPQGGLHYRDPNGTCWASDKRRGMAALELAALRACKAAGSDETKC